MKKLMFSAAVVAVAGGAFAAPLAYDYKASVKHMYLKEVKVRHNNNNLVVYQKYQKSASLKGYLIMDNDGVLSNTITGGLITDADGGATSVDYGRVRGFLVVQNSSAESDVRQPKIMPAVLDAKWIDTAFTKNHQATKGLAEGTLFVGGDTISCVRPQLDNIAGVVTERAAAPALPGGAGQDAGMTAYADYLWTSVYLFGIYNGPNWFLTTAVVSPFNAFETAWDANLPAGVRITWPTVDNDFYHDTWMNGAGFGKYSVPTTGKLCCGLQKVSTTSLESLSGNLKGGLFLCTENGIDAEDPAYVWFDVGHANCPGWEDQFYTSRLNVAGTFAPDSWQNDLWQDGAVEQATTDVISGTWQIKRNDKFFTDNGIQQPLSAAEAAQFAAVPLAVAPGTLPLWQGIKGAALRLKANNWRTAWFDGTEIFAARSTTRFDIPMITPAFAKYYGLGL